MQNLEKIYMDYAATTPMRPEVLEAMEPYFCEKFGNPSARYSWGRETGKAQVDEVVKRLGVAVQRLREMNPLWEGGANG